MQPGDWTNGLLVYIQMLTMCGNYWIHLENTWSSFEMLSLLNWNYLPNDLIYMSAQEDKYGFTVTYHVLCLLFLQLSG